ncbi:MAG: VWA domain-containing protein, partial [Rhodospirillaceae bacterium]|nr:VWA domain-containing protein [Rhodospirillaceae bacterium]
RMALTVFARIAAPQVRLTRDPNTVFFFLDHLDQQSPFRLEDDATWDTNVEQGIAWGLRALQKDRELIGPSNNIPTFVLVSDGETWSGEVARAITLLRAADIPLFVVGVGTQAGGRMPAMPVIDEEEPPPAISRLDRQGLRRLAMEGGGQYFEIDRDADRDIANTIINARRRPAALTAADVRLTDVHWPLIVVANGLLVAAAITTRRRAVLWWLLAGGLAALTASAEWIGR